MKNEWEELSARLRRTENILNASQALSKVGGWEYDVTEETIYWSEEVFRIHDLEPNAIGPLPGDYIPRSIACYRQEDQALVMEAFHECIDNGTPYDLVVPFTSVKGRTKWVRTCAYRMFEEGVEHRIYGNLMDVTERVQAETALREGAQKYRAILETAIDGFWLTDLEGNLLEVNEAYSRMSGYTAEELLELKIPQLEGALDATEVQAKIALVLERGHARFETRHRRKDGTTYDVEVMVQHLPLDGGLLFIFTRDITAAKKAEQERNRLQEQLGQAQKMESIGRLAGGVAHDFNNMLNVILGYASMSLEREDLDENLRQGLEEITKAANKSADVARQMLAFARKQTIAPRLLDLNETVSQMLKMLRRLIGEDIDLVWIPGPDLGTVEMDPAQVDQILMNLCVNARDAIDSVGKLTIETSNVSFDEAYCAEHAGFLPGDYIMLSVGDDGPGMSRETLDNLFEPFFTTKTQGTGLGLATVYGIVKQNKGFINVYSEPGNGSCFKIYLTRVGMKAEPVARPESPSLATDAGETVLLVEDDPSILNMTTRMLTSLGYQVLAAGTPAKAITLAAKHEGPIDLLMTDVVMPEMNGRDLADQILRSSPRTRHLFMSGYTANVIAHHGVLERGVNFIQKPFGLEDLGRKLREVLDA